MEQKEFQLDEDVKDVKDAEIAKDKSRRRFWKSKWKAKDGKVIRIIDMDDPHLINTIRMLRRGADIIRLKMAIEFDNARSFLQGEMALQSIDDEDFRIGGMSDDELLTEYYPPYSTMLSEALKRGLEV